jgi:ABC-type Fe3+/spermidine/putrescine transport system ATPase subunit
VAAHGASDGAFLKLDRLTKSYGGAPVVADLSLDIARGEALTLLGPSGCGKTTTLRMIAGLEKPDAGAITLDGVPLVSVANGINRPPERRKMGMVFQSYAIWPHMTVAANVGFPLKVRHVPSAEIAARVKKALAIVGLTGFEDRPAPRLSGGQQQRVALARALVYEPEILLLDEPLSNLDVKLREQMRLELKLLQERLSLTLVYVTHDQTEALSLSDRIALMKQGRIEQIGAPPELYERPRTRFVRDFLGKSVTLSGEVRKIEADRVCIALGGGTLLDCRRAADVAFAPGTAVEVSVRPEAVSLGRPSDTNGWAMLQGTVEAILYQGERSECEVRIGTDAVLVYAPPRANLARGQTIELAIATDAISVWPR